MALNGGADEAEARRERQERASRAMGGLLLRGYRMLGSACPRCGTILLQDKEQRLLCVTCQDPEGPGGGHAAPPPPAPRPEHCEGAAAAFRGAAPGPPEPPEPPGAPEQRGGGAVGAARAALLQKLLWAAQELPRTASLEASAQLCGLVRACADALGGLQALDPPPRHGRAPPETLRPLPSPPSLEPLRNLLWIRTPPPPINAAPGGPPGTRAEALFGGVGGVGVFGVFEGGFGGGWGV